jgi:carbamoyltransferase
MLFTAPVREERRKGTAAASDRSCRREDSTESPLDRVHEIRSDLPAITHVDYSARVQTVDAATNPALHAILRAFADRTGCAVLVNTSFNVRGEPPVGHPREAIAGFLATEMDCLALGPFFLEKKRLAPVPRPSAPARVFAPD